MVWSLSKHSTSTNQFTRLCNCTIHILLSDVKDLCVSDVKDLNGARGFIRCMPSYNSNQELLLQKAAITNDNITNEWSKPNDDGTHPRTHISIEFLLRNWWNDAMNNEILVHGVVSKDLFRRGSSVRKNELTNLFPKVWQRIIGPHVFTSNPNVLPIQIYFWTTLNMLNLTHVKNIFLNKLNFTDIFSDFWTFWGRLARCYPLIYIC